VSVVARRRIGGEIPARGRKRGGEVEELRLEDVRRDDAASMVNVGQGLPKLEVDQI